MRKVTAIYFITVDGVIEAPGDWQFDVLDEVMGEFIDAYNNQADTVLMGRQTYEEWLGYWPTSDEAGFSDFINNTPKIVFSNTLKTVAWGNFDTVKLVEGDAVEAVTKLKQQPGTNIAIWGSVTLVRWLLQNDLLDELHLLVHPVIAGKGKHLFADASEIKRLKLVETKTNDKGVAYMVYQVVRQAL
jgi:dihydrofolate reductase